MIAALSTFPGSASGPAALRGFTAQSTASPVREGGGAGGGVVMWLSAACVCVCVPDTQATAQTGNEHVLQNKSIEYLMPSLYLIMF